MRPRAVQHVNMPSPAPGKPEPQAVVQAGHCLPGQQLCCPWGPGGQRAAQEPPWGWQQRRPAASSTLVSWAQPGDREEVERNDDSS